MDKHSPRPRKVGLVDAGAKQGVRFLDSEDGLANPIAKLVQVSRRGVCEPRLGSCPNKLIGVKFGRVGREAMGADSRMCAKEALHQPSSVNGAAVPKQVNRATKLPQQVADEPENLLSLDVFREELEAQTKASTTRRDGDRRNGRHAIPTLAVMHQGCSASGSPSSMHMRDDQKPALVEEDQVGATSCRVFFYVANPAASTARWLPRRAEWLCARASGNSIPCHGAASQCAPCGSAPRSADESGRRFAATSTTRSRSRRQQLPSAAASQGPSSAASTGAAAAQALAVAAGPSSSRAGMPASSAPASLSPSSESGPPRGIRARSSTSRRPSAVEPPNVRQIRGVSCPI